MSLGSKHELFSFGCEEEQKENSISRGSLSKSRVFSLFSKFSCLERLLGKRDALAVTLVTLLGLGNVREQGNEENTRNLLRIPAIPVLLFSFCSSSSSGWLNSYFVERDSRPRQPRAEARQPDAWSHGPRCDGRHLTTSQAVLGPLGTDNTFSPETVI